MSKLFSALTINNLTLKNRIVVSPMCQYSSIDGFANSWHLVHLGQFAIGQAAVVIQEATAISAEGRISFGDLGIWKDEHIEKYKEITTFIKSQGSIAGIQLAHAGRKASTNLPWLGNNQFSPEEENGWQTVSSSDIPFREEDVAPYSLSKLEIRGIVEAFKQASRRAVEAGYQIIEIHAAHGYLIHQFLSPLINQRTDEYGGSFENRIRFLLEIVEAVHSELGEGQSLWVRISATDWAENGWDLQQSIELTKILKENSVEVIDVSTGGAVKSQKIPVSAGYQVPFSDDIKNTTGIKTGTVGLITYAEQAEDILKRNAADIILIGREFLKNPHLALDWAKALGVEIPWPAQYERAKPH